MASKISAVIPCFNAAFWIRETLESVISQSAGELETIVVDDGSTDGTGDIIRSEFQSVHLVRTSNQGPGSARNLGTRLSSGKFIQYLDADDCLAPGKVDWQLQFLEKSGADAAYGDWQVLAPAGDSFVRGKIVNTGPLNDPELDFVAGFWCPTGAYLFRRTIVQKVGGWNEELRHGGEDERFAQDCALAGAKFIHTPGVMAYFRYTPGSYSRRERRMGHLDHYRSVQAAELFWNSSGGIGDARRLALQVRLGNIARSCCDYDSATLEAVLDDLERISPGYIPTRPLRLRIASMLLGYRRAEMVASWYRKAKASFS